MTSGIAVHHRKENRKRTSMQTRSWLKRDWMFSKRNPIFVISLRSREVTSGQPIALKPHSRFSLQHCAPLQPIAVKNPSGKSPSCAINPFKQETQLAGRWGWGKHYKTSPDYLSRPTKKQNSVMKQCGGESRPLDCQRRKKKSKSNGIYFPTAIVMFFPLCSTPASHPTLQLFPFVDNQLTTSHRRRARLEMIFIRRMERKKSSWNILVVWISAFAVFHYDKW